MCEFANFDRVCRDYGTAASTSTEKEDRCLTVMYRTHPIKTPHLWNSKYFRFA